MKREKFERLSTSSSLSTGLEFSAGGREYVLQGKIGDGAVGLVRKAIDSASGRTVAVKLLAPDPKYIDESAFEDVAHRFKREGERGAKLKHENLVDTLAYEDNEQGSNFQNAAIKNPFLVMDYVHGSTLESLIKKISADRKYDAKPYVNSQSLSIAARVASALRYLHEHKITHRDVKPANIFISSAMIGARPSIVKLGDFGVTKWGDFVAAMSTGTLTMTSQQGLGTMKYMSPEQAIRPKEVSVRSDVFSFGITLFELFAGRMLGSVHHVLEIMQVRATRAATVAKMSSLGVRIGYEESELFDCILGCFYQGADSRPTSRKLEGNLNYFLEQLSAEIKDI